MEEEYSGNDSNSIRRLLPNDLESMGLRPIAKQVLQAALLRSEITTREIAFFIPKEIERDRENFKSTITWLNQFFKSNEVKILTDKEEPLHRSQYPNVKPRIIIPLRKIYTGENAQVRTVKSITIIKRAKREDYTVERNSLDMYFREINDISLLTAEEERELGRRIQEESDIDARNELIARNLQLVRWVIFKWYASKDGASVEDLIQEGNIGLMIAAEKYDYRLGRFSTYAIYWIQQAIRRDIMNHGDLIRQPVHIHQLRGKINRASEKITTESGLAPTIEEVGLTTKISEDKIQRILSNKQTVISIDEEDADGVPYLHNFIPDGKFVRQDILFEANQELGTEIEYIKELLQKIKDETNLPERDLRMFKIFYGLDGSGECRTLEYVGRQFGLSRERIRQIVSQIWQRINENGSEANHIELLERLARIDRLEKITESGK